MNRRYLQIMFGIGLLLVGVASVSDGQPLGVLLGLGGFYMLARQFEESRNNREREQQADRDYDRWRGSRGRPDYDFENVSDQVDRNPTTNANRVYSHALQAVQNAGLDASTTAVLPVDIGMLAHKGEEPPRLYRTKNIPNDIDYVQPFVQLRLPTRAKGKITFEILDDYGETVFVRTEEHDLARGRNLVVPSRRIPVHDALDMEEGAWTLRVSADDVLLAVHSFDWHAPDESLVTPEHIEDDGEISNELRAAMAESRLENMSLDDLLSFQDEPSSQNRSARSS